MASFVRRHKKKLIATAVIGTGLYYGAKWAARKYFGDVIDEIPALLEEARKMEEEKTNDIKDKMDLVFDKAFLTSERIYATLLPELQEHIEIMTQFEAVQDQGTAEDKKAAAVHNFVRLGQQLFTRIVAAVYFQALTDLTLHCKVFLLQRHVAEQQLGGPIVAPETQRVVLSSMMNLAHRKHNALLEQVADAATKALARRTLTQRVQWSDIHQTIDDMRSNVEGQCMTGIIACARDFLLETTPAANAAMSMPAENAEAQVSYLDAYVYEFLESAEFEETLNDVLESNFAKFKERTAALPLSTAQLPLEQVPFLKTFHTLQTVWPQMFNPETELYLMTDLSSHELSRELLQQVFAPMKAGQAQ